MKNKENAVTIYPFMVYLIWLPLELLSLTIVPMIVIFADGLPHKHLLLWNYGQSEWINFFILLFILSFILAYARKRTLINLSWVEKNFFKKSEKSLKSYPMILRIHRSHSFNSFNPESFIGNGWTIVEQDEKSLLLNEVNLDKDTYTEVDCYLIKGEERLDFMKRMKWLRWDALIFETLWENKPLIPEEWKKYLNGVAFYGTILMYDNQRYVLYLQWVNEEWHWGYQNIEKVCTRAILRPILPSFPN